MARGARRRVVRHAARTSDSRTRQRTITEPTTLTEDHLDRLKADLTLRHTTARWLAHEAAYPGMGALHMITPAAIERDQALLTEITALVAELEEKASDQRDLIEHFRWVRAELTEALR